MSGARARWSRVQALFEAARALAESERASFLRSRNEAPGVIAEVEALLAALAGPPLALERALDAQAVGPAPVRVGPYRIVERIGGGGMGEVYLGERDDGAFARRVAIKLLAAPANGTGLRARFRLEQRIHAGLEHPAITRLLDAGVTDGGVPFLVTDFVDGVPIDVFVRTSDAPPRRVAALVAEVCDAVAFAHSRLILHRDLKPSNILVDVAGAVRLLDFGIAKLLDDHPDQEPTSVTRPEERLMTLAYASPEQVRGEALSTASDVFALGVVLHELLAGERPFQGGSSFALGEAIVSRDPAPLRDVRAGADRELEAICLKALAKRPADRYVTAAAMGADLQRFLDHRPTEASRANVLIRARKLARRRPVATLLVAGALGLALAGGLGAAWQAHRAQAERDVARAERDRAEQVVALLLDLFDSDPMAEAPGRRDDLTLREFLTTRAAAMELALEDQPGLQATLLDLMANLHAKLSLLEEAARFGRKALALRRAHRGPDHAETAASLGTLGMVRQFQGRYDEAEAHFRRALEIRRREHPATHPLVAAAINDLSVLLFARGREGDFGEMLELDAEALAIREARFGPDSLEVAQSLNNRASTLIYRAQAGDLARAEGMLRRALAIRRAKLGDRHASTANTLHGLAYVLLDQGRAAEAEPLFEEAIATIEQALGAEHPRVSAALGGLGRVHLAHQRWDGAAQAFERSLAIHRAALPAHHPYIFDDLVMLAEVALGAGDPARALRRLEAAERELAANPGQSLTAAELAALRREALAALAPGT